MSLRRSLSVLFFFALVTQLAGCSWWHKRKVRKDFEGVKDAATSALDDMRDADAKVIKARKAMSAASKEKAEMDALVEKIHDFSVALQGAVPAAKKLGDAITPMYAGADSTIEATEVAGIVRHAQTSFAAACGHDLAFDDIDPCGEAYDDMLGAAYVLEERAKDYDVTFPIVRAPEKND